MAKLLHIFSYYLMWDIILIIIIDTFDLTILRFKSYFKTKLKLRILRHKLNCLVTLIFLKLFGKIFYKTLNLL